MAPAPRPSDETDAPLSRSFKKLRTSEDAADTSFQLEDGSIVKAHSQILCARAPFLYELCKDCTPSHPTLIEGVEEEHFKILLDFVYCN